MPATFQDYYTPGRDKGPLFSAEGVVVPIIKGRVTGLNWINPTRASFSLRIILGCSLEYYLDVTQWLGSSLRDSRVLLQLIRKGEKLVLLSALLGADWLTLARLLISPPLIVRAPTPWKCVCVCVCVCSGFFLILIIFGWCASATHTFKVVWALGLCALFNLIWFHTRSCSRIYFS